MTPRPPDQIPRIDDNAPGPEGGEAAPDASAVQLRAAYERRAAAGRQPAPAATPVARADLEDASVRWPCPECGRGYPRMPNGRMRNHGGSYERPQYCKGPAVEAERMRSAEGLADLTISNPASAPVYAALADRLAATPPPRRHGGQLRRPDPSLPPGWRWRR